MPFFLPNTFSVHSPQRRQKSCQNMFCQKHQPCGIITQLKPLPSPLLLWDKPLDIGTAHVFPPDLVIVSFQSHSSHWWPLVPGCSKLPPASGVCLSSSWHEKSFSSYFLLYWLLLTLLVSVQVVPQGGLFLPIQAPLFSLTYCLVHSLKKMHPSFSLYIYLLDCLVISSTR